MSEVPPWFRERDAEELAREAAQLAEMQRLERDHLAGGWQVRLKDEEQESR